MTDDVICKHFAYVCLSVRQSAVRQTVRINEFKSLHSSLISTMLVLAISK